MVNERFKDIRKYTNKCIITSYVKWDKIVGASGNMKFSQQGEGVEKREPSCTVGGNAN